MGIGRRAREMASEQASSVVVVVVVFSALKRTNTAKDWGRASER